MSLKTQKIDLNLARNLEAKLSETIDQTADLQRQMENVKASDMESVELNGAKGSLPKVVDEESLLRSLLESLKVELENVKKGHSELKEKEAKTESISGNLHVKLRRSRYELEAFIAEESKTIGTYQEMVSTLQQLAVEPENAQREAEEMNKEIDKLKLEAEPSRIALEGAEKQLTVALEEAEVAKVAETRALDEIKSLQTHRVEESNNIAEMKVAAAMAQVAVKTNENEALKRFEVIQKEIEDMKVATAYALKRAEMAEAARVLAKPSPQQCRSQKQNPPDKIVPVQKLKKQSSKKYPKPSDMC